MAHELRDCDLTRISWYLVTSLRAGRDWFGSLEMISLRDPEPRVRYYFSEFIKTSKIEGVESAIRRFIRQADSTLVRLFLHVLLQSQRGSIQLSKMLEQFGNLAYRTGQLKRKHQELQFTPRFQMWGTLTVTCFLVFIVPLISPIHMPTFLSQGRSDLFFAGVSLIVMGFILMEWLSWKTRRYFEPMIQMTFFFSFLGFFVESGLDLVTSWKSSLEMISFPSDLRRKLERPDLNADGMAQFLKTLAVTLKEPWPSILTGLVWVSETGLGVADFLKWTSQRESERWEQVWENQIKNSSAFSIIPLLLFIFPGAMFLMIGPQLLEIQ